MKQRHSAYLPNAPRESQVSNQVGRYALGLALVATDRAVVRVARVLQVQVISARLAPRIELDAVQDAPRRVGVVVG